MPKTVFHALKKDSESSVIKTLGEIQVCSLIAANARVNAVESCRLLKMNAAGNPSFLSSKTSSVAKSNPYAFIPCVKSKHIVSYRNLSWHYFQDGDRFNSCQVIYSQFGLAIHQNDHQARRRFVEWALNEIAVVPDFHKRILFSDEAHFWLNGYVNKQNCRIWSEANPQVYDETPLHPEN
ncbi:hypothetical protein TNCV_2029901 [Trichonephila clavipes]|nr:hypothetical protein TNCV_2029901 [Trichonephila clavipes]